MERVSRLPARVVWSALAAERAWLRVREAAARRRDPKAIAAVSLRSPQGYMLPARLHLPEGEGPFPAVLFCSGGLDGTRGAEGHSIVLSAPRLARHGVATLAWSPSGRDGAPGEEDRNGLLHQEECANALRALLGHPKVDPERVVVLSISFGVALAVGALTRWPELGERVRGLVDWEGPPSREWFEASRLQFWTIDEPWWVAREAIQGVGALRCPYDRFQSVWDHVHGNEHTLGEEIVDAALGATPGPPEVRLNGVEATCRPRVYAPVSLRAQGDRLLAIVQERLG